MTRGMGRLQGLLWLGAALLPQAAWSQSFDCAKAASNTEHAVCADDDLGTLDKSLAEAFRAAQVADKSKAALLHDQKQWLAARDRYCDADMDCLKSVYRARIAELRGGNAPAARPVRKAIASCRALVDHYRGLADRSPGEPPLDVLRQEPGSMLALALALGSLDNSDDPLAAWAREQSPPITLSPELVKAEIPMDHRPDLQRLPGTDLYALRFGFGTANCVYSIYFTVRQGVAYPASDAQTPEGDGDVCGGDATPSFGTLAGQPVAVAQRFDYTPRMDVPIIVSTWDVDRFVAACGVKLSYAPAFSEHTLNRWRGSADDPDKDKACTGKDCAALHQLAYELVAAVQKSPPQAWRHYASLLTPQQMERYEWSASATMEDAKEVADANVEADGIDYQYPLELGVVLGGQLYEADLGHYTIGWRYYGDWSVRFQRIDDGTRSPAGEFAIGMSKGKLLDAVVMPFSVGTKPDKATPW